MDCILENKIPVVVQAATCVPHEHLATLAHNGFGCLVARCLEVLSQNSAIISGTLFSILKNYA